VISSLTALFIIFAAVIGSTMMVGVFAYFLHRIRQLEAGSRGEGAPPQLTREMSELREELAAVEEAFAALSERLDFTEKLLMKGADADSSDESE